MDAAAEHEQERQRWRLLDEAFEYQDFVAANLHVHGIVLVNYQSKLFQYRYGENKLGLEIKFDKQVAETRHLWFETAEQTSAGEWIASGIHRGDAWLFGIGNYNEFWVFSVKLLRRYSTHVRSHPSKLGTTEGFKMHREAADQVAELYFNFRETP